MEIPFWEDSYKNDNVSTFGVEPNATIIEFEHLYESTWRILDIGCGDGKNSLYFSSRGFSEVDAFDLSENAIAKLHRLAERHNATINAWVQDLRQFYFEKPYDLVVSFGTLHFVEKSDWHILQFKSYTFEDEHPGVPRHFHASNKIVAQRVK